MSKQCAECRDGEHDDYDEDVKLVVIRDPADSSFHKRAKLCGEHRQMYADDGFQIFGAK